MEEKLSSVKQLILNLLRDGNWVSSKQLLKETNQKYFDRRIRELRDELGYDIETSFIDGEPHYRMRSSQRKKIRTRTYLTASQKKFFLENHEKKCALCKKTGEIGKNLFLDHRRPLIKNGSGEIENFQLLCNDCNNQKRSLCKDCIYDCSICYFAFPENFPKPVLIRPERLDHLENLISQAKLQNLSIEEYLVALLNKIIDYKIKN